MKLTALILAVLCASCAQTGNVLTETKVIDTACSWVKPIYISVKDDVTDGTARQILAHNRTVDKNCKK